MGGKVTTTTKNLRKRSKSLCVALFWWFGNFVLLTVPLSAICIAVPREKNNNNNLKNHIVMSSSRNQAPAKTISSFKVVLNAMFGPNPKYINFFNGTDSKLYQHLFAFADPAQTFPKCLQATPALSSLILTFPHPPQRGLHTLQVPRRDAHRGSPFTSR